MRAPAERSQARARRLAADLAAAFFVGRRRAPPSSLSEVTACPKNSAWMARAASSRYFSAMMHDTLLVWRPRSHARPRAGP